MLTNKDIIEALVNVGYTLKEICNYAKISNKNIKKLKNNEQVEEDVEEAINNFFRMNMGEVDISKFGNEEFKNANMVMTPTGFKKVVDYKEEGLQHCFELKFDGFNTIMSDKHQIQLANGDWTTIDNIKVGDKVKVYDEELEVKTVTQVGDINCCSFTVDGGEYYLDGVVSK